MIFRKLEALRDRRPRLAQLCEVIRLQLPSELRTLSFDTLAGYSDSDIDTLGQRFGVNVILLLQVLVALWPLVKLLVELFGDD
jgi:hypothetical protein